MSTIKPVMVRKVRKLWRTRQQGSAALITTIAVSIVLVILFVGVTTIATREIRQSISNDNANRALYGAEAGVEDAVRRLANDPKFTEPKCNDSNAGKEVSVSQAGGVGTSPDIAWTCRTVSQYLSTIIGRVSTDESIQLNTARAKRNADGTGSANVRFVKIEWNKPTVDSNKPVVSGRTNTFLPPYLQGTSTPTPDWQNRAAALEVTASWLPNTITAGTLTSLGGVAPIRTVLANPAGISAPSGVTSDGSPWNNGTPTAVQQIPTGNGLTANSTFLKSNLQLTCQNGTAVEYSCKTYASPTDDLYDLANLTKTQYQKPDGNFVVDQCSNLANCIVVLRIKARYAPASYRITFYDDTRTPVYMADGNATIDVTARSGTYYRRVVAQKQLTPKAFDNIFDNALFSGADICKTMRIYKDFRGAPDYTQSVDPTTGAIIRNDNPNAGKNTGSCSDGS